jgi:hypothetical protein
MVKPADLVIFFFNFRSLAEPDRIGAKIFYTGRIRNMVILMNLLSTLNLCRLGNFIPKDVLFVVVLQTNVLRKSLKIWLQLYNEPFRFGSGSVTRPGIV